VKAEPEQDRVKVTFDSPYPYQPHVLVTPEVVQEPDAQGVDMTAWNGGYFVANVTKDGFDIRLPGGGYCNAYTHCPYRVWFNWMVVGIEGDQATDTTSVVPVEAAPVVSEPAPPVEAPLLIEQPGDSGTEVPTSTALDFVVTTTEELPVVEAASSTDSSFLNLTTPTDQSTTETTDSVEVLPSDTP